MAHEYFVWRFKTDGKKIASVRKRRKSSYSSLTPKSTKQTFILKLSCALCTEISSEGVERFRTVRLPLLSDPLVLSSEGLEQGCDFAHRRRSPLPPPSVSHNAFSGPIPKELGNLKDLFMIALGSNNFSGTLPPELGNLPNLQLV
ncbi:hypothetical protein CsatB_001408 [Cannabis sativa]